MSTLGRRAEAWVKRVATRVGAALVGIGRRSVGPGPGQPQRILVLRVDDRVGNVLLTTPLLSHLTGGLPAARIDILVARSKRMIVAGIAEAIAFEKRDLFRAPWRFISTMRALRRAHYDVVIDASHWHAFSITSALILGWIGAPVRIAHDRGAADRFATVTVPPPEAVEPEVRTKLRLLEPLAIATRSLALHTDLGSSGPARDRMDAWFGQAFGDRPVLGLVPGARKLDHRTPEPVFAALGDEATACGAGVLVLWGPGEEALADRVAAAAQGLMAPATDVEALAALMRRCAAIATNDSGPMHLAVATGTPTIGLFTHADHGRWGHTYGPHRVVIAHGRSIDDVIADARAEVRARLAIGAATSAADAPSDSRL